MVAPAVYRAYQYQAAIYIQKSVGDKLHLLSSITSAFSEVAVSSHSFRRAVTALHSMTACRQNSVHDRSFSFSSPTRTGQDDDGDAEDGDGDERASGTGMPSKRTYHSDERRTVATREPNPCNGREFGALQMKHRTSTRLKYFWQ